MATKLKNENKDVFTKHLRVSTALNQNSVLFDFGNVMVHRKYLESKGVRIISGGSYLLSEFVGKGMLTSTVQGEQFMAPPSKIILRTIRELSFNHVNGCLIIIPANSGNTLNFGLAVTRALNDRLNVNLLTINDTFSTYSESVQYEKGLTAIVLITKIAGAMSEMQHNLMDIYKFCRTVMENVISIALTLSEKKISTTCICNKPGNNNVNYEDRHSIIQDDYCSSVVKEILNVITQDSEEKKKLFLCQGENVVLLLNNNRVLTELDEFLCVKEIVEIFNSMTIHVNRIYMGNFVNCLDGINFTATLLRIHEKEVLKFLDAPCEAPGWRTVYQYQHISLDNSIPGVLKRKERLAPPIRGPKLTGPLANVLLFSVQFACDALISCERQLNVMDSERGDGDTGTRLKNAAEVILKRAKQCKIITNFPFTFFESLSKILEATVGGTLGCIYSILFEAASLSFSEYSEDDEITPQTWLQALENAAKALKKYGNVEYGDGTMYDPIEACSISVRDAFNSGSNFIEAFGSGISKAEQVAQSTKKGNMKFPNPGAHAVGIWMRAIYEGVKLRCPVV